MYVCTLGPSTLILFEMVTPRCVECICSQASANFSPFPPALHCHLIFAIPSTLRNGLNEVPIRISETEFGFRLIIHGGGIYPGAIFLSLKLISS